MSRQEIEQIIRESIRRGFARDWTGFSVAAGVEAITLEVLATLEDLRLLPQD